jgi:hypothetical protein
MPRLARTKEHENWILRQCLEVLAIVNLKWKSNYRWLGPPHVKRLLTEAKNEAAEAVSSFFPPRQDEIYWKISPPSSHILIWSVSSAFQKLLSYLDDKGSQIPYFFQARVAHRATASQGNPAQGVYIIRWYIWEDFVFQGWAELMFLCQHLIVWSFLYNI